MLPSSPPRANPASPPIIPLSQPPRAGCGGGVGEVSEPNERDGLEGLLGDVGAGRAGADDEREPRLPPLPARAKVSPACRASSAASVSAATASVERLMAHLLGSFYLLCPRTQVFLQDFAGGVLRQRVHELDAAWDLVVGEGGAAQRLQFVDARVRALAEHDERLHGLPTHSIRDADDGGLLHRRVAEQHLLHLTREDLEARDVDHVLHAIDDEEIAVGVAIADVAGMEPAV